MMLIRAEKVRTQINSIRSEGSEITIDSKGINRIIREYYGQVYANKFNNLDKVPNNSKDTT